MNENQFRQKEPIEIFADLIRGISIITSERPRILVCGGRGYSDKDKVFRTLNTLADCGEEFQTGRPVTIIHGGAKGADHLADQWAVCNWQDIKEFKAEWDRFGPSAGYIRNRKMLKEGQPHLVVAFPGGKGTAMMVDIARKADVPVLEIQ